MQRIHLAGAPAVVTGDEIADALLEYAAELARFGKHAVVELPVLADEHVTRLRVLLGPTTQLMTTDVGEAHDLDGNGTVLELKRRTAELRGELEDALAAWPFPSD